MRWLHFRRTEIHGRQVLKVVKSFNFKYFKYFSHSKLYKYVITWN